MTNPASVAQAAVDSRAVHVAMARSVAAAGLPCVQALYTKANEFNSLHFGGQLTALLVEVTAPASPRAYATHQPKTPEGVDCMIRIAPGVVAEGELFANDVLLHEMIHVWQAETGNSEPGYQGHGPKFAAECNRIGAILGLPPVGVKGRGGLPSCAQWPLNVRPAGYYGESARVKKAQAKGAAGGSEPKAPKAPKKTKVQKALDLLASMTEEERADFITQSGL